MTKTETIKAAYGPHWDKVKDHVDEDGWCFNNSLRPDAKDAYFSYVTNYKYCDKWRPKSLSGIEDNNGWTKIESEEDLPQSRGTYYFFERYQEEIVIRENWERGITNNIYALAYFTHWQKIYKPKKPIH